MTTMNQRLPDDYPHMTARKEHGCVVIDSQFSEVRGRVHQLPRPFLHSRLGRQVRTDDDVRQDCEPALRIRCAPSFPEQHNRAKYHRASRIALDDPAPVNDGLQLALSPRSDISRNQALRLTTCDPDAVCPLQWRDKLLRVGGLSISRVKNGDVLRTERLLVFA